MRILVLLMILLLGSSISLEANNLSVKGKIVDNSDNHPLSGASVGIYKRSDSLLVSGRIADKNGEISFENLKYGDYFMKISSVGYIPKYIDLALNIASKTEDIGVIKMNVNTSQTDNVIVEAEKPNIQYAAGKTIVNVDKDIVNSNGSAFDVLKNTPSIEIGADGQVKLRGTASFRVLVDGKNPGGAAADPSVFLKQIPASILENIEIITNPSAKYEAEGSGGIINLIVKRKTDDGFNGLFMGNIGSEDRYNATLNSNYKDNFFNLFGNLSLRREINCNIQNLTRDSYVAESFQKLTLNSDNQSQHFVTTLKLGSDFIIDNSNKLTIYGNIRNVSQSQSASMIYNNFYNNSQTGIVNRKMDLSQPNKNFDVVANYKNELDEFGTTLTADAYYSYWNMDMDNLFKQETFIVDKNPTQPAIVNQRNTSFSNIHYLAFQSDLTIPLSEKTKIEAGIKADLNSFDTDNELYNLFLNSSEWNKDTTYSVFFKNSEDIYAAYLLWTDNLEKIDYSIGIRTELTNHNSNIEKKGYFDKSDYLDFFPSLSFSYSIDAENQIQFTYSSRVGRPQAFSYMPVKNIKDPFNIIIGNPTLKPEYYDSFELGYILSIGKHTINPVAFYKLSRDNIFMTAALSPVDNIMYMTYSNDSDGEFIGADINYQGQLFKGLNLNINFSYYNQIQNVNKSDTSYSNSQYTWDCRYSLSYYLLENLIIQINGTIYPEVVTPLGKRYGYDFVDCAVKYDFCDRNCSLTFRTSDIFRTLQYGGLAQGQDYTLNNLYIPESRHFSLSFSYKINNYQRKQEKNSGTTIPTGEIM